jgi:hypothetical protein
MTFLLTALRDDVEADLRDTGNTTWSTAQVDRAIAQALADYERVAPREMQATLTVSGRTADLSAAAPAGVGSTDWAAFRRVVAAEYPADQWPPSYVRWSLYGATLTLHVDEALSAADVVLSYETTHTLDGSTGTVPDRDRALLAMGAAGYALRQLAAAKTDAINTGGPAAPAALEAEAARRLDAFAEGLRRIGARPRTRQLYRPVEPYLSQDVVQFPD